MHFDADASDVALEPRRLVGAGGAEDGFDFVRDARGGAVPAGSVVTLSSRNGECAAIATVGCSVDVEWFEASAPAQPATVTRRFHLIRARAATGVIRTVWTWRPATIAMVEDGVRVERDGVADLHRSGDESWEIDVAGTRVTLARPVAAALVAAARESGDAAPGDGSDARDGDESAGWTSIARVPNITEWFADLTAARRHGWAVFELGEEHYRRTEQTWREAGSPRARVAVGADDGGIVIDVEVETTGPVFAAAGAVNPFDNESADINAHGVQLYCATTAAAGAWVLAPIAGGDAVHVRAVPGWGMLGAPKAEYRRTAAGFELRARLPVPYPRSSQFALDVIVNDASAERSRRRGQLILSGRWGEFAYLVGDRHHPSRLVSFAVD
jgi:hypothetical protein